MCHKLAYDPTKRSHEYFWPDLVKSLGPTTVFDSTIVKDMVSGTAEVIAPSASKPSRKTSPETPQDGSKRSPEHTRLPSILSTTDAEKRSNDSVERRLPSMFQDDPGRDDRLRNRGSVGDQTEEERQANVQPPSPRRQKGKGNRR